MMWEIIDSTHKEQSFSNSHLFLWGDNLAIMNLSKIQTIYEKNKTELKNSLDLKSLKDKKIINKKYLKLKILGSGELKTKIDITAHYASKQAQEKILKAGGKLNIVKK